MTDIRDTRNFKIMKWILFTICLIYIVLMIVFMFISGRIVDYIFVEYNKTEHRANIDDSGSSFSGTIEESDAVVDDVNPEVFKNILKIFMIIVAFLSLIVYSFGLIGAYKEHLCLTLTFAILMSIGTLFSFLTTFKYFVSHLMSLAITILAFAFARDLHRAREQMGAHPMVTIQTAQPVLQTVIQLYPNATIGQQFYPQQQYNAGMGVYGGPTLPQHPPNYSDVSPYMPSGLQNDYPTK